MSQLSALGANGKTLEFRFFVIRVYYEKLGHIPKLLVPKFRSDLFARLRDITEKQVPANLKPIVVKVDVVGRSVYRAGPGWPPRRRGVLMPTLCGI